MVENAKKGVNHKKMCQKAKKKCAEKKLEKNAKNDREKKTHKNGKKCEMHSPDDRNRSSMHFSSKKNEPVSVMQGDIIML